MIKILFHAREAGIATVIKALLAQLDKSKYQAYLDIGDDAKNILKAEGFFNSNIDYDIIIYGVDSAKAKRTEAFLASVEDQKCPKIALLDTCKGLERFRNDQHHLRFQFDHLFIMDTISINDLVNLGIDKNKIKVVINPVFENLKLLGKDRRNKLISKFGITRDIPIILLLSEPLSFQNVEDHVSLFNIKLKSHSSIIEYIQSKYKNYQYTFRAHPAEKIIAPPNWIDLSSYELEEVLHIPDCVVGLSSTPMSYAVQLGIKVESIAYQIPNWNPSQSQLTPSTWRYLYEEGIIQNQIIKKKRNNF